MNIYENFLMVEDPSRNETFNMANELWNYYRRLEDKESEQPKILKFIEQMMQSNDDTDAWHIFAPDRKIYKNILLLEQKKLAQKSLINYFNIPESFKETILYMSTQLLCTSRDEPNFEEYKKVWKEVFKNIPLFDSRLEQTILENQQRRQEIINKYSKEIEEKIEPIETHLLSFQVPFSCSNPNLINHSLFRELKEEIINEFNSFKMEGYLKIPVDKFKIIQSNYYESNEFLIIEYHINKKLNEDDINLLTKKIKGQISDGFGSNMEQRPRLIDSEVVYVQFDHEKTTFIEAPNNKIKMKP